MKPSPVNDSYAQNASLKEKDVFKSKKKEPLLSQIGKILSSGDGALFSSENVPENVIDQVVHLREGLRNFPSRWAGKRRVVGRIVK